MTDQPGPARPVPVALEGATLEQYLAFGFVPRYDAEDPLELLSRWSRRPRRGVDDVTLADLVDEGVRALRAAVAECAAQGPGTGEQVVFLSGGLDSRTILASLLEVFDRSEIVAATFGLPGEQDFDFAAMVAKEAGVRHEVLESSAVEWTTQGLVDSVLARRVPMPAPVGQRYLSYVLHHRIGKDNTFWDGLSGDVIGGFMAPREGEVWDWPSAIEAFLAFHHGPQYRWLTSPGFEPHAALPDAPFCSPEVLAYPDQLMVGIRQRCYTMTRILPDFTVRTPFLAGPWLDFILSAPVRYRQDQYLYREIQKQAFPALFSLPTTKLHGGAVVESRWVRTARHLRQRARRTMPGARPAPGEALPGRGANAAIRKRYREPGPLRDLVEENIADLAARGVIGWTDVRAALPGGGAPQSDSVVTRLVGLEINLKAADQAAAAAATTLVAPAARGGRHARRR
ncbi:asparagine synthase C-terminal domain-containing protein [Georgenia sp. SYP-B2076]|uniref:asparagine synthase-related protein n=1 Tax=Georgenia sp. SYP-B2076 TaxID=2495881 RepID=UPI0013DEFE4F|nr:asparagine synthase C-terminal domain-containing protein [Georgenia sp. SYP-B2076]